MDAIRLIPLILLMAMASCQPAYAETPLITCNGSNFLQSQASPPKYTCTAPAGSGTVTTTGSPANGNLTKFTGATSISNGDLSGDVTTAGSLAVTLATVNSNVGSFGNFTVNAKGLITAASTALANGTTATTQSAGDATTKVATNAFVTTAVNNAIAGVNPAVAVQVATTAASDTSALTYNNGASGVGATFTGSNNTALTFDSVTLTSLNQRVLIKNDTQSPSGAFNGVYSLTQLQTAILPPVLTRALDYDMPSDINNTGAIPVISGTVNASTSWVETATVNTVGTDPLSFTKFSINPTTILTNTLTNTHVLVGNSSNVATDVAVSGDCTMANTGAITCTKTNGSSFGTAATANTGTSGGTIPLLNAANTFSALQTFSATIAQYLSGGAVEFAVFSNGNSGTTMALNCDNGNVQSVTITGAVTFTYTTPTHPCKFTLLVTQDGTGHVYAMPSATIWPVGTAPTYSTAASAKDAHTVIYDGTNFWGEGSTAFATSR